MPQPLACGEQLVGGCTGFNESVLGRGLKPPIKHGEFKMKRCRAGMSFLRPNPDGAVSSAAFRDKGYSRRLRVGEPLVFLDVLFLKFRADKNSNFVGFVLKSFQTAC